MSRPLKDSSNVEVDVNNTSYDYWDKLLTKIGLSMNRGKPPQDEFGRRIVLSVGDTSNLESIGIEQSAKRKGKRRKGRGPDA